MPQEHAEIYAALGLRMTYDDRSKKLHVTADLARFAGRVGGPTRNFAPRPDVVGSGWSEPDPA
jgi:hypothetical protein